MSPFPSVFYPFGELSAIFNKFEIVSTTSFSLELSELSFGRGFKPFCNINVNEKFKFILGGVKNIVGKGENAGYHHFLFLPKCFQKATFSGSLKVQIMW